MRPGPILSIINKNFSSGKKGYWVLLDPDDFSPQDAKEIAISAEKYGADAIIVGGSILHTDHLDEFIANIKDGVEIPVILFPGDATQISKNADAILFMSLVSGRNPVNLIGEQVKGAPLIKKYNIEPIPMGYMLVESGAVTSIEFMSNTRPLPRKKPGIAAAHALAAQYMGMEMIYLEAGSGAEKSVPSKLIGAVKDYVDIPVIVGGGIRDAESAVKKLDAGADIIVTGNLLRLDNGVERMKAIAGAIRGYSN